MADAPEVKVRLTAEDTGVSAAIRQLGQELKNLKNSEKEAADGAFNLTKAFQGLVAIGGLIKLEELGKEAFDAAVNIGKMADKTGQSTQQLSVFHHVAEEMGVSTEAVDKSLVKAAKSITEFELGTGKAANGFALLGIKQKDLIGLNTDQKIALVTSHLGNMESGLKKTAAAQLIFSKGGAEFIPIANAIAGEGFDKITASVAKLGLLLDQTTTDSFRAAKASMQELADVGKGMATQFEAGLLPAINDVGDALVESLTQGGVGFQGLGKYAGDAVRGITIIFLGLGQTLGTVAESIADEFSAAWRYIRTNAETDFNALALAAQGHISQAFAVLSQGERDTTNIVKDEVDRQKAIYGSLADSFKADYANLFPFADEEARRQRERLARLRPEKTTEAGEVPDSDSARNAARDDLRRQAELDRIAKAEAALLVKQLEGEISIWKAYEKKREQVEKNSYEDGRLTTEEYYRRRQADLKVETEKEVEILRAELKAAEDEVTRAAEQRDANAAKAGQFRTKAQQEGPKSKEGKEASSIAGDYEGAAAKNEADRLAAFARFNELQIKINTTTIDGQTKSIALDTDKNKEQDADRKKVLEFEAQLAELQGKRLEKSRAEIEAQAEAKREELQKAGVPTDQIDAEIAKWKQLTIAVTEFEVAEDALHQKEKIFEVDRNSFDIARNQIEAQQRAGLISKGTAEKKINELIDARLPLLRQEAAAELASAQAALRQAQATGNLNDIAKAQQQIAAAQNLAAEVDKIGIKTHQLATNIKGALTQDFNTFFSSIITGTKTVGQAFAQLGINIVQSLEQIVAQMLVTIAIEKIFSALGFGPKLADTSKQKEVTAANTAEAVSSIFVQAIEGIPFPANLAAAPALAAVGEAEMGGLVAGAQVVGGSAAKGAYLPEDMIIQGHAKELVLPEYLSTGLGHAIRTGSFASPQAISQPVASSGSARHYHDNSTTNLYHHGDDARTVLDRELAPRLKQLRRNGMVRA